MVSQKLYIPKDIRRGLLQDLHSTHSCPEKMWRTVRGIWSWPALKNKIKSYVSQRPSCAETARSKTHQPPPEIPEDMLITGTIDRLGVDLFHLEGKDYLIMVDIYSNYLGQGDEEDARRSCHKSNGDMVLCSRSSPVCPQ